MQRLLLLFLLFSAQLNAQNPIRVGLKEGMSTSLLTGDPYKGFSKFGYVGGGYLKTKINGNWDAGFEILYTQKGTRHRSDYKNGDFDNYFLQLNYIDLPILFKFKFKNASFEIGPGYSILIKQKEFISIGGVEQESANSFNSGEFNINIGTNYTFTSHFGFNLRFTNSILPIRKDASFKGSKITSKQFSTLIALCLTYEFGKKGTSIWN